MKERKQFGKRINRAWLESNFPCMRACPVGTEAGRYVSLIAEGRYEEAYRVARRPNPFASVCGRICAAPCEAACRRGQYDEPIAIRALKRFVCERYGVESLIDISRLKAATQIEPNGKYVAVVGAGPAGLTAAHDLRLLGYSVTVFEKHDIPGGMLRLGVPEYRLSRELLRMEINAILSLGVELKTGVALGRDFTIQDLNANGYHAIFLACGAHKSRALEIEGRELDGVLHAVDFLLNINLGYRVELGERIVVIGGGNVAFDVARTAARQEPLPAAASDITSALDVARSAVRFGAREVTIIALESGEEIPADLLEIHQAQLEKVNIKYRTGPYRILGTNDRVRGIEVIDVARVFDEQGRFNPRFIPGTQKVLQADTVIVAIGQQPEISFIPPDSGIEITPQGTLRVNPQTLETTVSGIYAGGDLAFGARNAIDAIADGQRAAKAIDAKLRRSIAAHRPIQIRVLDAFEFKQPLHYDTVPRQPVPTRPIDRRVGIAEVEIGYDEPAARREASRCLKCWINTVFEGNERPEWGDQCILCGMCVDICPQYCIELVSIDTFGLPNDDLERRTILRALARDNDFNLVPLLERSTDPSGAGPLDETIGLAVMAKDETICIRCGLCAKRCPVNCITLESFLYQQSPEIALEKTGS